MLAGIIPSVTAVKQHAAALTAMTCCFNLTRPLPATIPCVLPAANRVQLMAAPFAEATLLHTAAALEQQMFEDGMPKPVPSVMVNPIQGEKGAHPLALEATRKLWAKKYGKSRSAAP